MTVRKRYTTTLLLALLCLLVNGDSAINAQPMDTPINLKETGFYRFLKKPPVIRTIVFRRVLESFGDNERGQTLEFRGVFDPLADAYRLRTTKASGYDVARNDKLAGGVSGRYQNQVWTKRNRVVFVYPDGIFFEESRNTHIPGDESILRKVLHLGMVNLDTKTLTCEGNTFMSQPLSGPIDEVKRLLRKSPRKMLNRIPESLRSVLKNYMNQLPGLIGKVTKTDNKGRPKALTIMDLTQGVKQILKYKYDEGETDSRFDLPSSIRTSRFISPRNKDAYAKIVGRRRYEIIKLAVQENRLPRSEFDPKVLFPNSKMVEKVSSTNIVITETNGERRSARFGDPNATKNGQNTYRGILVAIIVLVIFAGPLALWLKSKKGSNV